MNATLCEVGGENINSDTVLTEVAGKFGVPKNVALKEILHDDKRKRR